MNLLFTVYVSELDNSREAQ